MTNLIYPSFIPILTFILFILNLIIAPHKPYKEKITPFECGYHSFLQTRTQFTISFFIFGILFTLFDLELVLVYPISVSISFNNIYGICVSIIFLAILTTGFVFELGKKALVMNTKQDTYKIALQSNFNFISFKNKYVVYIATIILVFLLFKFPVLFMINKLTKHGIIIFPLIYMIAALISIITVASLKGISLDKGIIFIKLYSSFIYSCIVFGIMYPSYQYIELHDSIMALLSVCIGLNIDGGHGILVMNLSPSGNNIESNPGNNSVDEPVDQPIDQPVDEPADEPMNDPIDDSVNESINDSENESVDDSANDSGNNPGDGSGNNPGNNPGNNLQDEFVRSDDSGFNTDEVQTPYESDNQDTCGCPHDGTNPDRTDCDHNEIIPANITREHNIDCCYCGENNLLPDKVCNSHGCECAFHSSCLEPEQNIFDSDEDGGQSEDDEDNGSPSSEGPSNTTESASKISNQENVSRKRGREEDQIETPQKRIK